MTPNQINDAKKDFRKFCWYLWLQMGYDQVRPLGELEYDICEFLQGGPRLRGVLAWREFGKSYLTCAYVIWRLWVDENRTMRVGLFSASESIAKDLLNLISTWIDVVPWLGCDLKPRGRRFRQGTVKMDVQGHRGKDPSISAIGITGQKTGKHLDLIVVDDAETPETARTPEGRIGLWERVQELFSVVGTEERVADTSRKGGEMVFLGTYQTEDSLYAKLPSRGFEMRSWPVVYPEDESNVLGLAPILAKRLASGEASAGDPTAPYRMPADLCANKQALEGQTRWKMQFQLLTVTDSSDHYPLKCSDVIVMPVDRDVAPSKVIYGRYDHGHASTALDIPCAGRGNDLWYGPPFYDPEAKSYHGTKMWLDPSGGRARGDECAWAIVAALNGMLFVKRVNGFRGPNDVANLSKVAMDARTYGVQDLYVETNFGGDTLSQLLEPRVRELFLAPKQTKAYPDGWVCTIIPEHVTGRKEERICDTLEPLFSSHRIVFDEKVAGDLTLTEQMTRIQRVRNCLQHDDRIDALASCCKMWHMEIGVDSSDIDRQREQDEHDDMMRAIEDHAMVRVGGYNWLDNR